MRALLLTLTTCLFVLPAQAKYSGGTGEPDDPYQIATAEDLMLLGETPADYGRHFILTADIDLDPNLPGRKVFDKAVIAGDTEPTKEYFQGTSFSGVFDGNGHTISHLKVNGVGYLGLFGQLQSRAEVKDLGALDVDIVGSGPVGGLVGSNGGLSDEPGGNVTNCYTTGAVNGSGDVGGLVGSNGGTATHCYSTGAVSGEVRIGGLVGSNWGGVAHCYSTGVVSGEWCVGGVVGESGGRGLTDCYSTAAVSGKQCAGLVGRNWGSVTNCYSTGAVSGTKYGAGLVGESVYGGVTRCFWDIETSGQPWSGGGTGLTTAQMQDIRIYLDAGWDFVGETQNGTHESWQMAEGGGYPVLVAPLELQGVGTPEQPYLISNALELGAMTHYSACAHYRLTASIDLSDIYWSTAVTPFFAGTFDGNKLAISNLAIMGQADVGLFGRLAFGAEVKDLSVVDVRITGPGDYVYYVGGLAGYNKGIVTRCYSGGSVSGIAQAVGGLVGFNTGGVRQCCSDARVSGDCVGGLVGANGWSGGGWEPGVPGGDISKCFATGTVAGAGSAGGLVGHNAGTVTLCYSAGAVDANNAVGGLVGSNRGWTGGIHGIATECFWDIQTSGQTTSAGGTGQTTAEMQTARTFLDVGWDFVGETANGAENTWWIAEGRDYPRLSWQYGRAFGPDPVNGAPEVIRAAILRWTAGGPNFQHDIYFGEDKDLVTDATRDILGVYCGRQAAEMTVYDPGILEWGTTYYWRIDEVNEADPNSPWKGDVWSFTTIIDFSALTTVDDFEGYTDEGNLIFRIWKDGFYEDANNPGNGTGSYVGNGWLPLMERTIVHGGKQSMPMGYDNVSKPWYSEAERTWEAPQDWRISGADTLTLYFRGGSSNSPEPLYVGIEDSAGRMAVMVQSDPAAVLATEWRKWHIDLSEVRAAGVDVAAVKKMVIGVGDRKNPKPGGTGRIYIDDIRLTKRMP